MKAASAALGYDVEETRTNQQLRDAIENRKDVIRYYETLRNFALEDIEALEEELTQIENSEVQNGS